MDRTMSLEALHADFRATGTKSMPIAGMVCWAALGIAALYLPEGTVGTMALYIMAGILPLAFVLDMMKGQNLFSGNDNPLVSMFLLSIVGIGITVPAVLFGAQEAGEPDLIVLGMAILAGVIWIPYGWAAQDKVGTIHAVGRALGCYAAYAWVAEPYRASAICAVVVVSYIYSLVFMRKVGG